MNIRPASLADIPAIARVHMESWRTTYRGLVSDKFLDNLKIEDRIARWEKRMNDTQSGEFVYVAEDAGGDVIAFGSGGPEESGDLVYKGEVWALHVLKQYQGIGLGKGLFFAIARDLQARGINSLLVWVLAGNPARRFYADLGGLLVKERVEEFAGGHIDEVAYGWQDINDLLRR